MESYYTRALPEYFINLLVIIKCPYPLMLPTLLLKNRIENSHPQIKKRSFWFRYLVIYGKSSRMQVESIAGVRVGVGSKEMVQKEQLDRLFEHPVASWVWERSGEVKGQWGRVQRPAAGGQRSTLDLSF